MFQNVADMQNQKEVLEENKSKFLYRLKEIFKYQNIAVYILTFLMSMLSIKGNIMPFGLAMLAACVGEAIPIIGVFTSALIGTAVGNNLAGVVTFLITSFVYFFLVLFFKTKVAIEERNEEIKTGGKLFASCLIVSIVRNFIGVFLLYDVFMGIISASIIYVFYKIFVNGLSSIKNFRIKQAFATEELIATVIIIAIASTVFSNISFFGLNLTNVIIIFMIMVLGWKNGMIIGGISGISIGIAICFVSDISIIQILMFAVSGVFAGALNRFGRIGVIIGFIIGNAILTYWVRGATTMIIYFREIFVASIGLLLVPQNLKIKIEDLYGKDKLLTTGGDRRLESKKEDTAKKLKTLSELFSNFANETSKEKNEERENFLQDFLDNIEEVKNNIFYEEISNEENGIARDICIVLAENEILVDKDLIEILKKHNNYVIMRDNSIRNDLQEIVKIANRTLKIFQVNRAKEIERQNALNQMNESLKNASDMIEKCAEEITKKEDDIYSKKEQELVLLLKSKNINVKDCIVKKFKNNKFLIDLGFEFSDLRVREKEIITNISDIISKNIGMRMVLLKEKIDDEKEEYSQVYSSEDKFVPQVGSSKISKDGSNISGDCSLQIKLADGKYLLAISDGMGTGEKAREYSKLTLKLIKQLLISGFDPEESIKIINSKLSYFSSSKGYSTLDISILDLYSGNAELIKSDACTTYIKNKKSIRKIKSESLPVGALDKISLKTQKIELSDGDILVMCSDGVVDSLADDTKDWLEDFLKNVSTNNVQKLADLILAEAIDNSYGVAQDDMTVIACKIVKRK